jgi:YesN/AraC family two-component response regulator
VLSRSGFRRAGQLLRLIIEHVQTQDLAELRKEELTNAGHAVIALEKEQVRLRHALHRHLPDAPQLSRRAGSKSRPELIVHELLACIEQDYARPVTLQQCASRLRMNAAYLSALFSRAVGVPFKTYLTVLRMEKAKELLGDAKHTVSEVARAVGYANENRFRGAFRKATGLAPRIWRAALRIQAPGVGALAAR